MMVNLRVLLVLATLTGVATADQRLDESVRRLGSPYYEVRQGAARRLASEPAGRKLLLEAYKTADVQTQELVLDAFADAAPADGLPLLYDDLGTSDVGVANAQERLVAAVYGRARDHMSRRVADFVPGREWRLLEALYTLPAPCPTARRELRLATTRTHSLLGGAAARLEDLVADVDAMRARLSEIRQGDHPQRARRARQLLMDLLQRDTERVLHAVMAAGGIDGYYSGMYAIAKELPPLDPAVDAERGSGEEGGVDAAWFLLHIITGKALPEEGVTPKPGAAYEFLEPGASDFGDIYDLRNHATYCISAVGDRHDAARLLVFLDAQPEQRNFRGFGYELTEAVTVAIAALGNPEPLRDAIRSWEESIADRDADSTEATQRVLGKLGNAYSRLGEYGKAVDAYRRLVDIGERMGGISHYNMACALSRRGETKEAVKALETAIEHRYGDDPSQLVWLLRDADLEAARTDEAFHASALIRRRFREEGIPIPLPPPGNR
jgi:tetratricopeptide (TPR) repeat protein